MATTDRREDSTIDSDNDALSPVTVQLGSAEDRDDDDGDDGDDGQGGQQPGAPQSQQGQPPVPPEAKTRQARPGGAPNRPSKAGWRAQQEVNQLKQQIAEMRGRMEQQFQQQQRPVQQQADPYTEQTKSINTQMSRLLNLSANPELTDQQRQELGQQYMELEQQRKNIERQQVKAEMLEELRQEMQQQQPDPQAQVFSGILYQEFQPLTQNKEAARAARNYYDALVQSNHGQETPGLFREACAWACHRFNIRVEQPQPRMARGAMSGPTGGGARTSGARTFEPNELRYFKGSGLTPRQLAEFEAAAAGDGDEY